MRVKLILLIFLCSLLTACKSKTEQYYLLHPLKIGPKQQQCRERKTTEVDVECQAAESAAIQVQYYLEKLKENQALFGWNILSLQMRIADLKSQQQALQKNHKGTPAFEKVERTLKLSEKKLRDMMAIIRVTMHP